MLDFKVIFITTTETLDLRSRILRPNQPLKNYQYAGDDANTTFHLGIKHNLKIICNATFMLEPCIEFSDAKQSYRLRGMATDTQYQKQGFGKLILQFAELELKKRNADFIWFNARVVAENFYKKLNFSATENIFEITGAGPHKIMYKWLK